MKSKILLCVVIFIYSLLSNQSIYAKETKEISLTELLNEYSKIMMPADRQSSNAWKEISVALDYGVEIIRRAPDSLEAYFVISSIGPSIGWKNDPRFIIKRKDWDNRRLNNLNIPDETTPEDLIYLRISMFDTTDFTKKGPENPEKRTICLNHLKRMMNECNNKAYAALANVSLLVITDNDYYTEFLKRFPNHLAIPIIKLGIAVDNKGKDNNKAIDEINKLITEYKDLKMPFGWGYEIFCYRNLLLIYTSMKDIEKAKYYYNLIEKNAPDYYSLKDLKAEIDRGGKTFYEVIDELIPPEN